jgi:hypothetical protein
MFEHELYIEQATPDDGIRWNQELQESGLIRGQDYSWSYVPSYSDDFGIHNSRPRAVIFKFANPALATFYQLKWQHTR